MQAAGALGFDVTDEAWSSLCARFGNETTRTNGQENDDDTHLDLNMIGAYFVNKYDPLLEEIIRRLLIGIVNNSVRSTRLEARLRTVEEHLESTSMREIRERGRPLTGAADSGSERPLAMTLFHPSVLFRLVEVRPKIKIIDTSLVQFATLLL